MALCYGVNNVLLVIISWSETVLLVAFEGYVFALA